MCVFVRVCACVCACPSVCLSLPLSPSLSLQANYFCGCTRFNFTIRSDNFIEDMFTTTCPMTGILPGI